MNRRVQLETAILKPGLLSIFSATIAALLVNLAPAQAQSTDSWSVFPGDGFVPAEGRHVHDPTVIREGDRYFCFSTAGRGFGVIRSSSDLVNWKQEGPVLPETPQWLRDKIPGHRSLWAPDVLRVGGKLRMYYCASESFGGNTSYIGVAECEQFNPDRPGEGWRDLGLVLSSQGGKDNFNAIDPSTIIDGDNRCWMFYGSYYAGLFAVEIDVASGKVKDGATPFLVARNLDDKTNALEAPAIIRRGDYYYLFCSYGLSSQGVRSSYTVGVGRSKSIAGPYVDQTGKPMTEGGRTNVLKASPPMFGPGHCMAFEDKGRWLLAHHYYDGRHYWTGEKWGLPTLQVRELLWSKDGWPLPGEPVRTEPAATLPSSPVGRWTLQIDFTEPTELTLAENGTATRRREQGTWTRDESDLFLKWPGKPDERFLITADGQYFVGRSDAGKVMRAARPPAGR